MKDREKEPTRLSAFRDNMRDALRDQAALLLYMTKHVQQQLEDVDTMPIDYGRVGSAAVIAEKLVELAAAYRYDDHTPEAVVEHEVKMEALAAYDMEQDAREKAAADERLEGRAR